MQHALRRSTLAEQTAAHLCEVIRAGRWTSKLPGVRALAAECDVSAGTMRAALALLEAEHRITADGAGRCRRVAGGASKLGNAGRSLRVMVLLDVSWDAIDAGFQGFLFQLQRALEEAGHFCGFANKSQAELRNDLGRISRYVAKTPADAWLVAGGNKATLTWFAGWKVPALAVGGRCMDVPIASTGVSFEMAFRAGVRRLIELGHRRILLLGPRFMIQPEPALAISGLLEELTACGVTPSHYNLPDWEETPAGLQAQLDGSFRYTPPTAIIVTYTNWLLGVLSFLAERGLHIPRDVSVLCMNHEPWFAWQRRPIAHLYGDESQMVRYIVRWVNAVTRGRADLSGVHFPAEFVAGESLGPVPKQGS